MIRRARTDDLGLLQDVERAAGAIFETIGMAIVADDDPPSIDELDGYVQGCRAWVWVDENDRPIAYLIADLVDGNGHVEQVTVHPDHSGQQVGRALIEHAARWAGSQGAQSLTLTTFTDVAWNGPYYERLGFRYIPDDEVTPGLRQIRAAEAAAGLDAWPRACMRLAL